MPLLLKELYSRSQASFLYFMPVASHSSAKALRAYRYSAQGAGLFSPRLCFSAAFGVGRLRSARSFFSARQPRAVSAFPSALVLLLALGRADPSTLVFHDDFTINRHPGAASFHLRGPSFHLQLCQQCRPGPSAPPLAFSAPRQQRMVFSYGSSLDQGRALASAEARSARAFHAPCVAAA